MKNVKEITRGNNRATLEFTSSTNRKTISLGSNGFNIVSPITFGDLAKGNYTKFEADGTAVAVGEAACWDDLRFPASQTKTGSNLKPDFDQANIGLLFPNNDTAEKIYIIVQLPHEWKLGTGLRPHIHFIQSSAAVPVFKMEYKWYINGGTVPTEYTPITTVAVPTFEYPGSGSILQILSFPEIGGSGINAVSSMMDIVIYRDDSVVTGDVLVKEFDIHYQIDTLGSRKEFTK